MKSSYKTQNKGFSKAYANNPDYQKDCEKARKRQSRKHGKSIAGKQDKRQTKRRRKDSNGNWVTITK